MAVVLPKLGNSKNSSTKDQIIYLLSQEWPLTAKQIFNRILKEKSSAISYQAVHKTLKEMLEGNVLEKKSKGYCLDSDWISQVKDFGLKLEKAYSDGSKRSLRNLFENDTLSLTFETALDFGKFMIHEFFPLPNLSKVGIINARHCYPLIGVSFKEIFVLVANSLAIKWFALVKTDTVTDHFLSKNFTDWGYKFKFGVNCVTDCDVFVVGDYICQIYWPNDLMDYWDNLIAKVKDINGVNLKNWFDFLYNKNDGIQVIVNKNSSVAERIRQKTLKYFKSEKK